MRRESLDKPARKREAFRLRLEGKTQAQCAEAVGVKVGTVARWENGWTDAKGEKHPGWKAEMARTQREQESAEYTEGLALKQKRIQTYDRLAQMAIKKIERDFPGIVAKTPADAATLINEVRKLSLAIAKEKDELPRHGTGGGAQTNITLVKNDITFQELSDRYADRAKVIHVEPRKAIEEPTEPDVENVDDASAEELQKG